MELIYICVIVFSWSALLTASDQEKSIREQLLECFEAVPVTVPGIPMELEWFTDVRIVDLQDLNEHEKKDMSRLISPGASKLLRCYVVVIEGIDSDVISRIKCSFLKKFAQDSAVWKRPTDNAPIFESFQYLYRMGVSDHIAAFMKIDSVWFHCCDNDLVAKKYSQHAGSRPLHELLVPQSIMLHMVQLAKENNDQEYHRSCYMRERVTPQALSFLTEHACGQSQHYESSCMRFNNERFIALAKKLFDDSDNIASSLTDY